MLKVLVILIVIVIVIRRWIVTKEPYTIATEDDLIRAHDYAIQQMCVDKGYQVINGQCHHTERTCWRDSSYPPKDGQLYLEWVNGECVLGLPEFRRSCEEKGLSYDPEKGECRTNCDYCHSKFLPFINGDCYRDPLQKFTEDNLFGRSMSRFSPYQVAKLAANQGECDQNRQETKLLNERKKALGRKDIFSVNN